MKAADHRDYIVRSLMDAACMYEDGARAFLAQHDAGVRTGVLAEAAAMAEARAGELIQAAKKDRLAILRGVHDVRYHSAECWRAAADELRQMAAAGGESTQPAGFFQPGRTYRSPHTVFTAPELISTFRVEHVTRHPDRGHLRAIGWIRTGEPGSGWHGDFRDEDEADGWTEVTEGCDAAKGDPAAASNASSTSTT